jgi:hypothetical protein
MRHFTAVERYASPFKSVFTTQLHSSTGNLNILHLMWGSHCKSCQLFFCQKCGNMGNRLHTFECMCHVLLNVIIRWGYMYSGAHAFCMQTSCWWPHLEMVVHKMPSAYMIMLQTIQQTMLRMFSIAGGGKCYNTLPVLPTIYSKFTLYATIKQ